MADSIERIANEMKRLAASGTHYEQEIDAWADRLRALSLAGASSEEWAEKARQMIVELRDYVVNERDAQALPRKRAGYQRELDEIDALLAAAPQQEPVAEASDDSLAETIREMTDELLTTKPTTEDESAAACPHIVQSKEGTAYCRLAESAGASGLGVPAAKTVAGRLPRESECTTEAAHFFYAQGWNDCRVATLTAAPQTWSDEAMDRAITEYRKSAGTSTGLSIRPSDRDNMRAAVASLSIQQVATPHPAAPQPTPLPSIDALMPLLGTDDPAFSAWRDSVPDKHWAKMDLSALRIGYELGKLSAAPQPQDRPYDWPECSGDPMDCPENEGFGCCKTVAPTARGDVNDPSGQTLAGAGGDGCGEALAWMHEDDASRVISARQKSQAIKDGGASASSVAPYTIALTATSAGTTGDAAGLRELASRLTRVPAFASQHEDDAKFLRRLADTIDAAAFLAANGGRP